MWMDEVQDVSRQKGVITTVIFGCGQKKGRRRYCPAVFSKVSSLNLQIML